MALEAVLRRVASELTAAGVPFALIGGLAVSVRTEPRFTRDADLVVAVATDAEAESLVHRIGGCGFIVHTVLEQHAVGRLATVRLSESLDSRGPVVDLLFASSGIEAEVAAEAELLDLLPQLAIPVARTGHLIALKVLSRNDERRPQDLVDLRSLIRSAGSAELERARHAVELIMLRGFNRGRDLRVGLNELT